MCPDVTCKTYPGYGQNDGTLFFSSLNFVATQLSDITLFISFFFPPFRKYLPKLQKSKKIKHYRCIIKGQYKLEGNPYTFKLTNE